MAKQINLHGPVRVIMKSGELVKGREMPQLAPPPLDPPPARTRPPAWHQPHLLKKHFKRLHPLFNQCGQCGNRAYLYEAYEPSLVGFKRWCYMCGARDDETLSANAKVRKWTAKELRALLEEIRRRGEDV